MSGRVRTTSTVIGVGLFLAAVIGIATGRRALGDVCLLLGAGLTVTLVAADQVTGRTRRRQR